MEGFKGTPGKWRYSSTWGDIKTESGGLIAEVVVNGAEDENGALLAAAPELLEALQGALLAQVLPEFHAEKARAAIAKALGQ